MSWKPIRAKCDGLDGYRSVAAAVLKALGYDEAVIHWRFNPLMTFVMTHLMPQQMALSLLGSMMSKTMDPAVL